MRVAGYHGPDTPANITQTEEGRAEWAGTGCAVLGLSGRVDPGVIVSLASGMAPNGDPLSGINRNSPRNACYDLTFAPHKSVSLAALVGNQPLVIESHRRAVSTVLDQLEWWASPCGRLGVWGQERTRNLTAAHIIHTHSRAGDPHLHSHLLIFNMTLSRHKTLWRSLDNRFLFMRASVISGIYHQSLGSYLEESGFPVTTASGGSFRIAAMPEDACEAFSKRRREVLAKATDADSGRAKRWINDAGRGHAKLIVEGYRVDLMRWRKEAAPWLGAIDAASTPASRTPVRPTLSDAVALVREARRSLTSQSMRCTIHALTLEVFRMARRPYGWPEIRRAIACIKSLSGTSTGSQANAVRSRSLHQALPPGVRPSLARAIPQRVGSRRRNYVRPELSWPIQNHYSTVAHYERTDHLTQGGTGADATSTTATKQRKECHSAGSAANEVPATPLPGDEQRAESVGIKASL